VWFVVILKAIPRITTTQFGYPRSGRKHCNLSHLSGKIHLVRGDKVVQNALSSQNIVAISFPIEK